eukprot:m.112229 g.112229  ORF g.112229 m.112229 type:complete len:133 (+) comp12963_c0_seq5:1261-1659(+)
MPDTRAVEGAHLDQESPGWEVPGGSERALDNLKVADEGREDERRGDIVEPSAQIERHPTQIDHRWGHRERCSGSAWPERTAGRLQWNRCGQWDRHRSPQATAHPQYGVSSQKGWKHETKSVGHIDIHTQNTS